MKFIALATTFVVLVNGEDTKTIATDATDATDDASPAKVWWDPFGLFANKSS